MELQGTQPMPVAQPMQVAIPVPQMQVAQPMQVAQQPASPFSHIPTALGNVGGLPASPLVLGPPIPIKKQFGGKKAPDDGIMMGSNTLMPAYNPRDPSRRFTTNDPRHTHIFLAPAMDFVTTEADFDRGVNTIGAEQGGDTLAPLLSGGTQLIDLELDVEGRLNDMRKVIKNNCYCIGAFLASGVCTLCGLCMLCKSNTEGGHKASCDGEHPGLEKLAVQARAHHLKLTDQALVYTRDPHVARHTKNYLSFDQYGHRYPATAEADDSMPGATLHVPLQHASLEVVAKSEIEGAPIYALSEAVSACDMTPASSLVVVRVGEGVRVVVAVVECGPAANTAAFVDAFNTAKKNVRQETPELAGAYNAWFGQRLSRAGTMAGAAPRANQVMDRGGLPGRADTPVTPYVRAVGPLPQSLGLQMNQMSANKMMHFDVQKDTVIHSIRNGPLVHQLNGGQHGDRIVSINGVPVPGQATQEYLQQAQAASPPGGGGFMQVQTRQPHFQPSHLLTVGPMPAGAASQIQFDANRTPPTVLQPDAAAAASGLLKGDIVMQAVIDGVTHNTNPYTGQQFINAAANAQQTTITVLQTHRMANQFRELPWVPL